MLNQLEKLFSAAQGKGYGSFSIPNEIKQVSKFLNYEPKLAIDVGGNIGNYTEQLIKSYKNLEVHIFEPASHNVSILHSRFKQNKKIIINKNALSNVSGGAVLYADKNGSGLASLTKRNLKHFDIEFTHEESIIAMIFEEYWKEKLNSKAIDLVKIDVEGHELDVLHGFGEALKNTRIIQFEFGGCNIDTRTYFQDFWNFFSENDFIIYRIAPLGSTLIKKYSEMDEVFRTTNYIAINRKNLVHG